jgi:hypothetical protein
VPAMDEGVFLRWTVRVGAVMDVAERVTYRD